ncbi:MinD/ParA family ATP-binding protein [Thermomonospora umbrina]|uniref:MinD-like ATPase involved in chromosome partitioning or flagellar assembly n=1 Tax=Thermomonospora umbrina TaxID=111806 RepID=A0A3D9T9N2_9ACTN|nr:MinD/ParA family protein [Thermomonospora umbrina]REF00472.1 MinD-like ATPase involved in chromosome partitioning or flagellar assembly [Thermomonospora umbrina]
MPSDLASDTLIHRPTKRRRNRLSVTRRGRRRTPAADAEQLLTQRIGAPITDGHHRLAIVSVKGGVGKTTLAIGLGATLAAVRNDTVIAVDVSPAFGTLADRLPDASRNHSTAADLAAHHDHIHRLADVRGYTSKTDSGLEILGSDTIINNSRGKRENTYPLLMDTLLRYYPLVISDCGPGIAHRDYEDILARTDQVVVAGSLAADGARSVFRALDWLHAVGHGELARHSVVTLTAVRPDGELLMDTEVLADSIRPRCRRVVRIPHDPSLAYGAEITLDALNGETRRAFLELAAAVADHFPRRHIPQTPQ